MPINDDNVLLPEISAPGEGEALQPKPFTPDELVACESCARSNPPTRANCLYCGAALPVNEYTLSRRKPALRALEKWEHGYNNIHLPEAANPQAKLSDAVIVELAGTLKLSPADLSAILSCPDALPLARAATFDEATLVERRLTDAGLSNSIVADDELGSKENDVTRIRSIQFEEAGMNAFQSPEAEPVFIAWRDVSLIVTGRAITRRLEIREQTGSRSENRILDSSQFFDDETLLDIYSQNDSIAYRITAKSFDFSCLASEKSFRAEDNMNRLVKLIRERATSATVDVSYNTARKLLELVWPLEQQTESAGWRRDRPGKITVGSSAVVSNYTQFTKYSRLRYHLHPQTDRGINES